MGGWVGGWVGSLGTWHCNEAHADPEAEHAQEGECVGEEEGGGGWVEGRGRAEEEETEGFEEGTVGHEGVGGDAAVLGVGGLGWIEENKAV